jgi:hypothetical protein
MSLIEQLSFSGRIRVLRVCKEVWYAKNDNNSKKESYVKTRRQTTWKQEGRLRENTHHIAKRIAPSKEGATSDSKTFQSLESPLSNRKKDEIAILMKFSYDLGFNLTERDFGIWLSKYDANKIKRNLSLATRRKYKSLPKFLESALKEDYGREDENIIANRDFFKEFCKKYNLHFKCTEKYVTLEGGKDLQFKLEPELFNKMLINHFTKNKE